MKPAARRMHGSLAIELREGIVPTMTPERAMIYAKLLLIGCPPVRAVKFLAPKIDTETAKKLAVDWQADAAVLQAQENELGAPWIDLPIEERIRLAYDKHLAEAAFYLWTESFVVVEHRDGLEKMRQAREMLRPKTTGAADEDDWMQAFARASMDFAKRVSNTAKSKQLPVAKDVDEPADDDNIH